MPTLHPIRTENEKELLKAARLLVHFYVKGGSISETGAAFDALRALVAKADAEDKGGE